MKESLRDSTAGPSKSSIFADLVSPIKGISWFYHSRQR